MLAAALLPDESRNRLLAALPNGYSVVCPSRIEELIHGLAAREWAVLILDPIVVNQDAYAGILDVVDRVGLDLVLWTPRLTALAAARVAAAAHLRVAALFEEFDPDERMLRALVRASPLFAATPGLFQRISVALEHMRLPVRVPVIGLAGGAPIPHAVAEFAGRVRLGQRAVEREFTRVGLRAPHWLLNAVRAARAWPLLHRVGLSLEEVCRLTDYHSIRTMTLHFRRLIGMPPRAAARDLPTGEFVDRMAARVLHIP